MDGREAFEKGGVGRVRERVSTNITERKSRRVSGTGGESPSANMKERKTRTVGGATLSLKEREERETWWREKARELGIFYVRSRSDLDFEEDVETEET